VCKGRKAVPRYCMDMVVTVPPFTTSVCRFWLQACKEQSVCCLSHQLSVSSLESYGEERSQQCCAGRSSAPRSGACFCDGVEVAAVTAIKTPSTVAVSKFPSTDVDSAWTFEGKQQASREGLTKSALQHRKTPRRSTYPSCWAESSVTAPTLTMFPLHTLTA